MALQAVLVFQYTEKDEKTRTRYSIVEEACRMLQIEPPSQREAIELNSGDMAIEDFFALRVKIFFNFTTRYHDCHDDEIMDQKTLMVPSKDGPMYKRRLYGS